MFGGGDLQVCTHVLGYLLPFDLFSFTFTFIGFLLPLIKFIYA